MSWRSSIFSDAADRRRSVAVWLLLKRMLAERGLDADLLVRKESYVKAVGRGMNIDLSTFSALNLPPSSGWAWQDFDFGYGYYGCACTLR